MPYQSSGGRRNNVQIGVGRSVWAGTPPPAIPERTLDGIPGCLAWIALLLSIVNLYQRRDNLAKSVLPWGIGLSAVVTLLLMVSGWYGGELIYRYKIAVFGDEHKAEEQPGHEALHA